MTTIESIQKRLEAVLVGSCVFDKQDIVEAIKNFCIIFCNDTYFRENGNLVVEYDDITLEFETIWEDLGPRHTLKELIMLN